MGLRRYRGRHLLRRPRRRAPAAVGAAAVVWASAPAARAGSHVVAPGETLSGIARTYGTTVAALARVNHLDDVDLIVAGQRLRVPARATTSSVHVVRRGETLSSIAARYGTTVRALARVNRVHDVDLIVVGTELRVPGSPRGSFGGVEATLERAADQHDVDNALVKAVAWHESGWRQHVVSSKGALGIMQVMPGTANYVNDALGGGDLDPRRARDNVRLGVIYLGHLLHTMPSRKKALAAYYSGPGAVDRRLDAGQRRYVKDVSALTKRY
jgi:N-acetylmuramoyl-L-alanine amidase